jgi:hypothetical protein
VGRGRPVLPGGPPWSRWRLPTSSPTSRTPAAATTASSRWGQCSLVMLGLPKRNERRTHAKIRAPGYQAGAIASYRTQADCVRHVARERPGRAGIRAPIGWAAAPEAIRPRPAIDSLHRIPTRAAHRDWSARETRRQRGSPSPPCSRRASSAAAVVKPLAAGARTPHLKQSRASARLPSCAGSLPTTYHPSSCAVAWALATAASTRT